MLVDVLPCKDFLPGRFLDEVRWRWLDDLTSLSPALRVVGLACVMLLVLLVLPVPITIGESFASADCGC